MKRRRGGGLAADRRRRGSAAGSRTGTRRQRGTSSWTPGDRVVSLTAARRRAAVARREEARRRRGRPAGRAGVDSSAGAPGTIDFHLATCVACARAGGRVLLDHWARRGTFAVREKGRNDFVTIADRQAEDAIVRLVRSRFPDHSIVAEESAPTEGTLGFRWYVDPLDGTTNYIHGYPLFGVSVGLADAQGMRAAVVFDPVRDEMFTAARGQGSFLNGRPIRVARPGKLAQSLLVTGIPFRSVERLDRYLASFRAFMLGSAGIRRDGSAALDLAYVACGRYDGFWEMGLSSWDVAAGSLIVVEAGGVVTDFQGRAGYIDSGDILAASPDIHPAMLKIVREAYGS